MEPGGTRTNRQFTHQTGSNTDTQNQPNQNWSPPQIREMIPASHSNGKVLPYSVEGGTSKGKTYGPS